VGESVRTVGEAHDAARALVKMGARAVLVKGGHLGAASGPSAVDVLAIAGEVVELRARRLVNRGGPRDRVPRWRRSSPADRPRGDGAGGKVGRRGAWSRRLRWAKRVHHAALARAVDVGAGMRVLVF